MLIPVSCGEKYYEELDINNDYLLNTNKLD